MATALFNAREVSTACIAGMKANDTSGPRPPEIEPLTYNFLKAKNQAIYDRLAALKAFADAACGLPGGVPTVTLSLEEFEDLAVHWKYA